MKRILAVAISAVTLSGCSDPDGAAKTVRDLGMTDVAVGGYSWLSCGKEDTFATSFTATNPQGRRVSGTVCRGLMKGSTVRFD